MLSTTLNRIDSRFLFIMDKTALKVTIDVIVIVVTFTITEKAVLAANQILIFVRLIERLSRVLIHCLIIS
jgi:hypothetical protein